jgi:hypothetical protein
VQNTPRPSVQARIGSSLGVAGISLYCDQFMLRRKIGPSDVQGNRVKEFVTNV